MRMKRTCLQLPRQVLERLHIIASFESLRLGRRISASALMREAIEASFDKYPGASKFVKQEKVS